MKARTEIFSANKKRKLNANKASWIVCGILTLSSALPACPVAQAAGIAVKSSDIQEGAVIDKKYTADGADLSPNLSWSGIPDKTKSIAISCTDPDAPKGTWWHWTIFNIKPEVKQLGAAIEKSGSLSNGALQGKNDFGKTGYNGPDPPGGKRHHYNFKVFALDSVPALKAGCSKQEFSRALEGHVLAEGQLTGTYKR